MTGHSGDIPYVKFLYGDIYRHVQILYSRPHKHSAVLCTSNDERKPTHKLGFNYTTYRNIAKFLIFFSIIIFVKTNQKN